jgi:hypothetical protein
VAAEAVRWNKRDARDAILGVSIRTETGYPN